MLCMKCQGIVHEKYKWGRVDKLESHLSDILRIVKQSILYGKGKLYTINN